MHSSWRILLALPASALALPQGTGTIPPSPTGAECTYVSVFHSVPLIWRIPSSFLTETRFHEDHWDCITPCETVVSTRLAIDATVTDYAEWLTSMNNEYSTSGISWSGSRVFIHTSIYEYPGGSFTGYGVYDSHALTRAGYSIITEQVTTTTCPPTSATLPPSPTGSDCSPHGDHCEC